MLKTAQPMVCTSCAVGAGKENGDKPQVDIAMKEAAKPRVKRDIKEDPLKESKKARKEHDRNWVRVGSGRQAAQNLSFQDKSARVDTRSDMLEIKEAPKSATEMEALLETEAGMPSIKSRRVGDFSLVNETGVLEPIEALQFSQTQLYLSGVVYPLQGQINKEIGRRVERIGPVISFSLDCTAKTHVAIILHTSAAQYITVKPAAIYKKLHSNLAGQADIVHEIYHTVHPQHNGNFHATLEEVIARVARSKVLKGFSTPREGILLNGKFILSQLGKQNTAEAGTTLADSPFAKSLVEALKDFKYVGAQANNASKNNAGIVIRDPKDTHHETRSGDGVVEMDAQMEADEEFARQLQAKMDVEARGGNRRPAPPKGAQGAYIKVSEAEIADDYPAPAAYRKEEEELDELLLFDEELAECDPEDLPRRILTDFSIYNAEGLMASLELLPMWTGVDTDVELYASGVVIEDDGEDFMAGAHTMGDQALSSSSKNTTTTNNGSGSDAGGSSKPNARVGVHPGQQQQEQGMRMYLSQIREWNVEFGADMLFITIRTDVAWYRLSVPALRYKPWFDTVLKCSRIAGRVLGMLSEESRASKVSFSEVVNRSSKDDETSPTFVSKKSAAIERFLTVHGQIFLSCFTNFPLKTVRNSSFATILKEKLAAVRHSKLYRSSFIKNKSRVNRNPMRDRAAGARSKPMTATATTMVKSIWQAYFTVPDQQEGAIAQEIEEDDNEEENDDEDDVAETALAEKPSTPAKHKKSNKDDKNSKAKKWAKIEWVGSPLSTANGRTFYASCCLHQRSDLGDGGASSEVAIALGDAIVLECDDPDGRNKNGDDEMCTEDIVDQEPIGLVQAIWQSSGTKYVQVRLLVRGSDTVLGDAASESEIFLTDVIETQKMTSIVSKLNVRHLQRAWDASRRAEYFKEDALLRARNEEAARQGQALELFWRRQYLPHKGMFCDPPKDLQLGTRLENTDNEDECDEEDEGGEEDDVKALPNNEGFIKDGITYHIGDFMFVGPDVFEQMPEAQREIQLPEYLANSRFHKGSHVGLRAWGVGRLVKLGPAGSKKTRDAGDNTLKKVTLKRFWRPEDISEDLAYNATSYYDIYAGDEELTVDVEDIVGPVNVHPSGACAATDISNFICVGSFSKKEKKTGPVPSEFAVAKKGGSSALSAENIKINKRGGSISLASMDIFAGVGGLSEGMHQAGAAKTKWAIEYEAPAAEAFKLNNPDAAVFCNNCNVLLHAAMVKAGLENDCLASEEAVQASKTLSNEDIQALPLPGQVDFICGGPPCQGYSGMNRFNKGNWSMVQNSMVMSFLSYADFYRPRYFLLENVRNFVSHNKSFTFRLTLRSLLDMGYQVRFGVLNAGNFGVAQSRKRTFIWAAAPGEILPDWPRLMHAFRTPQLTINLPGDVQYTAVPQTDGAPLRPVTVRDAIGDLPAIGNGHDQEVMRYTSEPISAFQRFIRGECTELTDHIAKQMNELNLERCRCIPKNCPGADWRVLEQIVAADPSRKQFKGQDLVPWCLPNTADRHNGWRGLFGRLDWAGHFPTSTTDPQPMGKVGQVFHPEQDRIVSVRECARAQGFPDRIKFSGSVHNKHRQVGNAVPPPLAAALGRELYKALEKHAEEMAKEAEQDLLDQV